MLAEGIPEPMQCPADRFDDLRRCRSAVLRVLNELRPCCGRLAESGQVERHRCLRSQSPVAPPVTAPSSLAYRDDHPFGTSCCFRRFGAGHYREDRGGEVHPLTANTSHWGPVEVSEPIPTVTVCCNQAYPAAPVSNEGVTAK